MHLYELPLWFALAGLTLYTVLGGADFGAGFWQLLAGKGKQADEVRDEAHRAMAPVWEANHVLADLRPHRRLDRLSDRLRLDRVDALDPALHRRHRHRPAWGRLRPARGDHDRR